MVVSPSVVMAVAVEEFDVLLLAKMVELGPNLVYMCENGIREVRIRLYFRFTK